MKRSAIGIGSASIVLVFAVLCLTVFALISLSSAVRDRDITEASAEMVIHYYEADTLAEYVLAEISGAETVPESVRGVAVSSYWDWESTAEIVSFSCPISDSRELYVEAAVSEGSHDVLQWKMRDVGTWGTDEHLDVWQG